MKCRVARRSDGDGGQSLPLAIGIAFRNGGDHTVIVVGLGVAPSRSRDVYCRSRLSVCIPGTLAIVGEVQGASSPRRRSNRRRTRGRSLPENPSAADGALLHLFATRKVRRSPPPRLASVNSGCPE